MRRAEIEALVRDAPMAVRREAERHFRERLPALRRQLGRQRDGEVRALTRFSSTARKPSGTWARDGLEGPKPVARKS